MTKRPFIRKDGVARDTFELPGGKRCTRDLPLQTLDGPLSDEQRSRARGSARQEWDPEDGAHVLSWEQGQSAETLEALLAGLAAGNFAAPMPLLRYVDNPAVRPALVEAVRRASPEHLANFAQVVGLAGGPGAKEALRERLTELMALPTTFDEDWA